MVVLKRLSKKDLKKIASLKSVFLMAEELTGVPWQAVAAVWYRESFSVTLPKTPGGQFQFDPIPERAVILALFDRFAPGYVHFPQLVNWVKYSQATNVFDSGAVLAACWLRSKSKFNISVNHSDDAIKDAFYGYNGKAWGPHPESSPYVYNEFDAMHHGMTIRGSIPDGHGGRKFISTIDQRPGAFTVYKQLLEEKI